MAKEKIIGIDLGTTNSCVAVMEAGSAEVITNTEGKRTTPSVVAFLGEGHRERKVGDPAKRQAVINPLYTFHSIKRFIGKGYKEALKFAQEVPYQIAEGKNQSVKAKVGEQVYSPQEISAMVLQKIKHFAAGYVGGEVKKAVITVPAYFNDSERQATKEAGEIAGLEVVRIINEPTAAALAYGLDKRDKELKVAVFDLGGGTFDISILELGDGVVEVRSTNGDTHLGGDNFDEKIVEWLVADFQQDEQVDLRKDPAAHQRLREAAEKAKQELSSSPETEINLPYIAVVDGVPKHLVKKLSRADFERITQELYVRLAEPCKQALRDAKLNIQEIDEVLLVGGSTRIPRVQQEVEKLFGRVPSKGVNADEVVAMGAAIQGGIIAGEVEDVVLLDVIPISLGIETMGGVFTKLIEGNTTIPTRKSQVFSTAQDNQTAVDVHVLQGERPMAQYNKTIGRFQLAGIKPAQRGAPQIEVAFDIDANGMLKVTGKDKETNKEQTIHVKASSDLTPEEIERMKQEAKANEAQDNTRREKADKLNQAETLLFQTEKQLKEQGSKLSEELKGELEAKLAALREAHSQQNMDVMAKAQEALEESWKKALVVILEAVKQEQEATQGAQEGASSTSEKEHAQAESTQEASASQATDVDFEEVQETK